METKLVIGRHLYGLLKMPGAIRLTIALSPDGAAALERLATCSKSAVVDLAVRLLDAMVNAPLYDDGMPIATELASKADYGCDLDTRIRLRVLTTRFYNLSKRLEKFEGEFDSPEPLPREPVRGSNSM